jgi:hypothetical protein
VNPERSIRLLVAATAAASLLAALPLQAGFRVTPYLQNPAPGALTLSWLSDDPGAGRVALHALDGGSTIRLSSSPVEAGALDYHPAETLLVGRGEERASSPPFLHEVRLEGLAPGAGYRYEVEQGAETARGQFVTPPLDAREPVRFVVFGDSETEPESAGSFVLWPDPEDSHEDPDTGRYYLVDEETGYRENLSLIREREPHFVAIAGDLVESGGEQRDWDAYWRSTAPLAANTFLLPALGNHDYYGGPGVFGFYAPQASARALAKYRTYFDLPGNGTDAHAERYYALRWGPVTLVVLDLNNGLPQHGPNDSNFYMLGEGEGGSAPDWQPGSPQYRWLEETLRAAQQRNGFTFVVAHHCPYSSGVHGVPPGRGAGLDPLSGLPLRALSPLFLQYGVDALFTGHDEMYERSAVPGQERLPDGATREHVLQVYDVGVAGDGLRGPVEGAVNPYRAFLAHVDSPERWENGVLLDGGKHYGHLEVNVEPVGETGWRAQLDMVYLFPLMDADGAVHGFERRLYDDRVVLQAGPAAGDH